MQRTEVIATVDLGPDQIAHLFDAEYKGWCPLCRNTKITGYETMCCNCLAKALAYHKETCGCQEETQ